jgi:integrase
VLTQTGLRIGEPLGLTWQHLHLGDDPHILVAGQFYEGQRKRLKTDASMARLPLAPSMGLWLAELRPVAVAPEAPVLTSATGTPLEYSNLYSRVLRPALIASGIAVRAGEDDRGRPVYDYQGVAFHAFRSLLLAQGKNLRQVHGWLRHSQLTTTLRVYIHDVDDGLGGADAWDEMLHVGATPGAPEGPPNIRRQPQIPDPA